MRAARNSDRTPRSHTYVASRRARAVRAKYRLAGLTRMVRAAYNYLLDVAWPAEGKTPQRGVRLVKPARLHFARTARALRDATCVSEASCPNFEPRAHARLTGLTSVRQTLISCKQL